MATMDAFAFYKAGELDAAIKALDTELRMRPDDAGRRTFLFELLCFAGAYDRAEKQLNVLADANKDAFAGAMLYRAALHAQRTREDLLRNNQLPERDQEEGSFLGSLNGSVFSSIEDEDPRFGANLEVFIAGSYTLVPFRYIDRIEIAPPKRLRDLFWASAMLTTTADFRLQDLGEVLIPTLAPGSSTSTDDQVRLGRATIWQTSDKGGEFPLGQKCLLVDGEEYPLLSVRDLRFTHGVSSVGGDQ
ncbi:type VI secretion system accessory protein TagJ [Granulicella sp. dw_53]|uniref:type VI secretion system accessory protein TagJ n=1 Tax=Granulicella sp. dw_53 TaxID=2719792 RepID=UPI0021084DBB|nr:type VI secretion system accessory protein TagJ [Granulicella sp. dw_53]